MFNFNPLVFFNVQKYQQPGSLDPTMAAYWSGLGFDQGATMAANQNMKVSIDRRLALPPWFQQYFDPKFASYLKVPTSQIAAASGVAQAQPASLAEVFRQNEFPTPDSVFAMTAPMPGPDDALKLKQIVQKALTFTGRQNLSNIMTDGLNVDEVASGARMINGGVVDTEGAYDDQHEDPEGYGMAVSRFQKTLAGLLPYIDKAQASQMINFVNGKMSDGRSRIPYVLKLAKTPLLPATNRIDASNASDRRKLSQYTIARQIKLQQQLPSSVYNQNQNANTRVLNIANQHKFFKEMMAAQRLSTASKFM